MKEWPEKGDLISQLLVLPPLLKSRVYQEAANGFEDSMRSRLRVLPL